MSAPPPYLFDEFFASGREESISPFLTPSSRKWGKNLSLKTALLSLFLLLFSFLFSFFSPALSSLFLLFVYLFAGVPALIGAIEDLKNLEINIDVLMTLAALLSVLIGSGMEGGLLLVLFELSAAMELMVADKTKSTLLHLNKLSPRFGFVIDAEGAIFAKAVQEIAVKSRLLIRAGEVVPLDGVVIEGASFVNLVSLTGESHPIPKSIGDEVQAGAYNLDGTLTLEVTRTSSDSTLGRMIRLITEAQEAKPRLQRFLDRFGKWYALTIMSLSLLFCLTLPLFFSLPFLGDEGSIYRSLAFLIAASPCALILATPTAYLSAVSSCAKRGILLKGGTLLDALAHCQTIAFDKTGTLTTGKLECTAISILTPNAAICSEEEALAIAYALERNAVHPIAEAITSLAQQKNVPKIELQGFKAIHGYGLEGIALLGNKKLPVFIGHAQFIQEKLPQALQKEWEQYQRTLRKGGYLDTLLLIGESLFSFHFVDALRPESTSLIERIKKKVHLTPWMLTGDREEIAKNIAAKLGIENFAADLRPQDKLEKVAFLAQKEGLIMVGDGINDAPALARATVGISLGKIGSATAVDASDVVFLNDDLTRIDWLILKARKTLTIVKQNITLALIVICFAATPALFGLVPLWIAVILHEGGSVLVGLNSLRLLRD